LFSGVSSGMELDGDGRHLGGLLSCPQLASNASVFAGNLKLVGDKTVTLTDEAKKEAGEAGVDTDVIDGNGADVAAEADEPTCETRAKSPLTWAICPIVNGLADLTDWLFNSFILPLLETAPL